MTNKARRRFLRHILLDAPILSLVSLIPATGLALAQEDRVAVRRRLRFTLNFSNPQDRTLENQHFWCYLPASPDTGQRLSEVQVSMPYHMHTDVLGHRILELSFDVFPGFAQKTVMVTTEVEIDVEGQKQVELESGAWLAAERFIESDDARIRSVAAELHRETPMRTVRAIYDWVQENIGYAGYLAEDMGALYAMRERRGDCTEYANLVVALARANGIPARMVGGYVADRDLAPRPQDYHSWSEVLLESSWNIVDAQKGNWLASPSEYIVFRIYREPLVNPVGSAHRYRIEGGVQVSF